ncbi:outer membrane beta-barrel protein [Ginsengibacter hankyongi]|uniref:Outer membrane beta-barrel protein n=1 Tax=Ginsengibacter hankyongi TaxID=2607284 RepID=A0A5J5IBY0_9BACT|nr:TonB dependent receptor [Ginsengibacter hankyongi]KAA9035849.1 outer membrane beta-barrel protein [Ginsengibacter hankyongi]
MKKLTVIIAGFFLSLTTFSQSVKVSGSVNDPNENKPVKNAVIALLTPKDSFLYKFTRSDAAGRFTLTHVKPGKYILMTTHPYFADLLDNIEINNDEQLAQLNLISKSKLLQEVIIKSGSGFRIKGDTTVYTADSFKVSANANVGELLKKLPGIQVDKDGKITAMGETVQKVLVDGEEFFGDDPGMAVKNLRADAVKEVQVFDKKSDQAEFTGIDDGKTQKTINLKLKENAKHGYFGKADVTGGTQQNKENRYNENLLFSSFRGKRKLSAFLLSGNTGQDGLSWQDEQKYGGGDDNISMNLDDDGNVNFQWTGNTNDDEPYVDPQNGFMTNVNAGMQYSNKWNDKYNFNLSPKYNSQQYTNRKQTFTETQVGDSVLDQNSTEVDNVNRHNFKIRGILDMKLDSMNSLKITVNTNFYHTESGSMLNSISTGNNGTIKNTSSRDLSTSNDKNAISGNILFRHKFHKSRRTLTFTGNWDVLNNKGTNFLKSFNQAYLDGAPSGSQDVDQMKDYNTSATNLTGKIVYTEPLAKEYSLELAYQLSYNYGTNDQLTYSYTPFSNKYDVLVDSLSNQFKQNIVQNIPSARINFANKKVKLNIGSGFGFTNFDLQDLTFNKDYTRDYVNFYPSANFTYTYKPNHGIRVNYTGNTTQPTINQLQPLRNNNDYFNQYIGNPDLKPSFTNSFNVSHNSYNFLKDIWMYQSFNIRLTSNSITNNRIINVHSGKTVTQPINTNGSLSLNFYGGFGVKIKKIDTRINFNPNISYNKYADIINSVKSFSKTVSPGVSVWISKSKEKKYDFSVSDQFNYNANTTSQNNTKIHYNSNTVYLNATVYYKKVWALLSDLQIFSRQKTSQFDKNLNSNQWGARLQRTFKDNEFTAYISVHDILNDNIGVSRGFYSNTYTQVTNDRLKRYFMIGFEWDFKNKTAKTK